MVFRHAFMVAIATCCWPFSQAVAADLTVSEVAKRVFTAPRHAPVDFSGLDLSFLDLSGLDFKQASLNRSDLYGVDLTRSNLAGSNLGAVRLDRATIIGADFSGADLRGATIRRPTSFSGLRFDPAESPRFPGAKLNHARIMARMSGADFSGADLSDASLGPDEPRGSMTITPRTDLLSANFSGSKLCRANLVAVVLAFANLRYADLSGADLSHSDLSKADLTGADLTGANLTGADLDGAVLRDVRGLDSVQGLALAMHAERALR